MTPVAGTDYLETEVMTATPQRLQLMLINAAIRSASQGRNCLEQKNNQAALAPILRAQRIVAELLTGLNPESKDGLVQRVAGVYLFIYRSLIAANLSAALPSWTMPCECWKLNAKPGDWRVNNSAPKSMTLPASTRPMPWELRLRREPVAFRPASCRHKHRWQPAMPANQGWQAAGVRCSSAVHLRPQSRAAVPRTLAGLREGERGTCSATSKSQCLRRHSETLDHKIRGIVTTGKSSHAGAVGTTIFSMLADLLRACHLPALSQ